MGKVGKVTLTYRGSKTPDLVLFGVLYHSDIKTVEAEACYGASAFSAVKILYDRKNKKRYRMVDVPDFISNAKSGFFFVCPLVLEEI